MKMLYMAYYLQRNVKVTIDSKNQFFIVLEVKD